MKGDGRGTIEKKGERQIQLSTSKRKIKGAFGMP